MSGWTMDCTVIFDPPLLDGDLPISTSGRSDFNAAFKVFLAKHFECNVLDAEDMVAAHRGADN